MKELKDLSRKELLIILEKVQVYFEEKLEIMYEKLRVYSEQKFGVIYEKVLGVT